MCRTSLLVHAGVPTRCILCPLIGRSSYEPTKWRGVALARVSNQFGDGGDDRALSKSGGWFVVGVSEHRHMCVCIDSLSTRIEED